MRLSRKHMETLLRNLINKIKYISIKQIVEFIFVVEVYIIMKV